MPVSIDVSGKITTPNVVPNNPELSYQPDDQARQLYTVRGDDGIQWLVAVPTVTDARVTYYRQSDSSMNLS